jgi:hypothetical protein
MGSSPDRVKPKTIKLVFVASPLSTQHLGERANTGRLGIWIMCPSGATCLSADWCFSGLALWKSNWACWSGTKQISLSSHWKLTLFSPWHRWKISELVLNNNHSLTGRNNTDFIPILHYEFIVSSQGRS